MEGLRRLFSKKSRKKKMAQSEQERLGKPDKLEGVELKRSQSVSHRRHVEEEWKHDEFNRQKALHGFGEDPETRRLYKKAIEEGVETDNSIRVMIVGCYGQGKTTLVQRMKGESVDNIESTDGIVVSICISGTEKTSPWLKDKILTDENIPEKLALLALSAPSTESSNSFSGAVSSDSTSVTHGEKTDEKSRLIGTVSESKEDSPPDTSNKSKIYDFANELQYKQFEKALKQRKKLELDDTKRKHISLWDFGGQYIYYATHQLFHSANAVYLLVFDLSKSLNEEVRDDDYPGKPNCKTMKDYIIFWMHSIHSFVGRSDGKEPVVILVGTHRDMLQSDEQAERYFEEVRELFVFSKLRYHICAKHFALPLTNDANQEVNYLKEAILEVGDRQEFQRAIPAKWVFLECKINQYVEKHIISFQELQSIDQFMYHPINEERQLKLFLKYHHAKGTYFYFDEEEMFRHVVVNPQFVIDAFRCIIKAKRFCQQDADLVPSWKKLSDEAILEPELFRKVWKSKGSEQFTQHEDILIFMLKKNRIIAEVMKYDDKEGKASLKPMGFYIVPSLLKRPDDGKIEAFLKGKKRSIVSVVYSFDYMGIVETIFQRILATAIGTWPVFIYRSCLMIFDNGGVFELDFDHAGILKLENENIELCVVNFCPENTVSAGMGDYFRRFVEVVIHYEFSKLNTHDFEVQSSPPYEVMIRCQHDFHANLGGRNMLPLKKIQERPGERIKCPDGESHSLNKKDVQKDWFTQVRVDDKFPSRKLTTKEYSKLSSAIGYEWRMLGVRLIGEEVKLQQIDMDNDRTVDKIYELLLEWDKRFEEKATLDVLVKELRELPADSVNWEMVYNLKDNFYQY